MEKMLRYVGNTGHFDGLTNGQDYNVVKELKFQYVIFPNDLGSFSTVLKDKFSEVRIDKDTLTQEESEWLEVMRNLKNKSVREVIEVLELTGDDINSAFTVLHRLFTDDEEK